MCTDARSPAILDENVHLSDGPTRSIVSITRSNLVEEAREYAAEEPLFAVEDEHVEILPETFSGRSFGWRDAEWVVQWYYRRHLGAYPDADRRKREADFGENDFEDVLDTLPAVIEMSDTEDRLDALTLLHGVDVPVASAFLQFMIPDRYVVLGEREWRALRSVVDLDGPYPATPSTADYVRFDAGCRRLREQFDVDSWTLYRALWRLGAENP